MQILYEMSNPVFWGKKREKYHQSVVCWISPESGIGSMCQTRLKPIFKVYEYSKDTDYGKCPKNSNTKASDKMTYANSVDPDQTAPEGAVWSGSTLFAIPLNI